MVEEEGRKEEDERKDWRKKSRVEGRGSHTTPPLYARYAHASSLPYHYLYSTPFCSHSPLRS